VTIPAIIDQRKLLTIGFFIICLGTIFAYSNSASEYEPSIFNGTPTAVLIFISFSLLVSVYCSFLGENKLNRNLGIVLAGITMVKFVTLPIIRGYYYLGEGDALTHLGYTRDINDGLILLHEFRYPAIHTIGSFLTDIADVGTTHALLIVVVTFVFTFFLFVPLCLRELTTDPRVVRIGIFSGFLLLQLNFLGVHMHVHPTSQAIMFAAVILYLFIASYNRSNWRYFILFVIGSAMLVLLHPQQAANFVIFFGTMATAQVIHTIGEDLVNLPTGRSILPAAGGVTLLFWLWADSLPVFESALSGLISSLLVATDTATEVADRGVSLAVLGGSLEEVFLKLFFVSLLYCIFAGIFMLVVFMKFIGVSKMHKLQKILMSQDTREQVLMVYFMFGFVSVSGLFIAYIVADITSQYFRHYGFMMVIVTIMGSIALGRGFNWLRNQFDQQNVQTMLVVVIITFLLLTLPVLYPSPYIYQTSGHVPESQMVGYERSFEYGHDDITYDHVRSSASRYGTAINGPTEKSRSGYYREGVRRGGVPDHFADRTLREYYDLPIYLGITEADRVRDGTVYQGFRFSHDDFAYLEREPGIDKIQSNGGFEKYLVNPIEPE